MAGSQDLVSAQDGQRRLAPVRRIITGHDSKGRSIVVSDEASPFTMAFPDVPDFGQTDLWRVAIPADNDLEGETCSSPTMAPPDGGAAFRVVQYPPDSLYLDDFDHQDSFGGLPDGQHAVEGLDVRNPTMHRTRSVDFAVVIEGEIFAIMDVGEVKMGVGDTLIQRGTVHGWSNRSDEYCRVAFVLIDAKPLEQISK